MVLKWTNWIVNAHTSNWLCIVYSSVKAESMVRVWSTISCIRSLCLASFNFLYILRSIDFTCLYCRFTERRFTLFALRLLTFILASSSWENENVKSPRYAQSNCQAMTEWNSHGARLLIGAHGRWRKAYVSRRPAVLSNFLSFSSIFEAFSKILFCISYTEN